MRLVSAFSRLIIGSLLLVFLLKEADAFPVVSQAVKGAYKQCYAGGDPHMFGFDFSSGTQFHPQGIASYLLAQGPCQSGQPINSEWWKVIDSWKPWAGYSTRTVSMAITLELRNPANPVASTPFRIRMGTRDQCNSDGTCTAPNMLFVDPNMSDAWEQMTNYTWASDTQANIDANRIWLPNTWRNPKNPTQPLYIQLMRSGDLFEFDLTDSMGFAVQLLARAEWGNTAHEAVSRRIQLAWGGNYFFVRVDSSWQNNICGMCGNYNGNPADDFQYLTTTFKDGQQVLQLTPSGFDSRDYPDFGQTCTPCVDLPFGGKPSTTAMVTFGGRGPLVNGANSATKTQTHAEMCRWFEWVQSLRYFVSGGPKSNRIFLSGQTAAVALNPKGQWEFDADGNAITTAIPASPLPACLTKQSVKDSVQNLCSSWVRDPAWSACTRMVDTDALISHCVVDVCVCSEQDINSSERPDSAKHPCKNLVGFFDSLKRSCTMPDCSGTGASKTFCDNDGLDTRTIGCKADQRIKVVGGMQAKGIQNTNGCVATVEHGGEGNTKALADRCNGRSFCDLNIDPGFNWLKVSWTCECPASCPMNAKTTSKDGTGAIRCECNDGFVPIKSTFNDALLRCDPATCAVPSVPGMTFDDCDGKKLGETCFVGCEPPYTLRSSASATVSGRATRVQVTCERAVGANAQFKLPQCVDDVFMARSGGIPTQVLFDERWCYEEGVTYNAPTLSAPTAANIDACQDLCRDTLGCNRFVFDRSDSKCRLFGANHGAPIASPSSSSGPRVCPAPVADGWCFQWGFTIKNLAAAVATEPTALKCQQRCAYTASCNAFVWNAATQGCHLSSSMENLDVTTGTATTVAGPKACPYRPNSKWCFEDNLGYFADTSAYTQSGVASPFKCQMMCSSDPSCKFFTWKASKDCIFHRQGTAISVPDTVANAGGARGPRFCPTAAYCLENHVSFNNKAADTTVSVITTVNNVRSADKCQIECQGNTGCRFFTWEADTRNCILLKDKEFPNAFRPRAGVAFAAPAAVSGPQGCHALGSWCSFRGYSFTGANLVLSDGSLTSIPSAVNCQKQCQNNLRCNFWSWDRATLACTLFAGNPATYPPASSAATDNPVLTEMSSSTAGPKFCKLPSDHTSQQAVAYRAWLIGNGNCAQNAAGDEISAAHAMMNTPWNAKRGNAYGAMTVTMFAMVNAIDANKPQTLFQIGSGAAYITLQVATSGKVQLSLRASSTADEYSMQTDDRIDTGKWFFAAFTVAYKQACLYVVSNYKLVGGDYYCTSFNKNGIPDPQSVFSADANSHILVGASHSLSTAASSCQVDYFADNTAASRKQLNVGNVVNGAIREVQLWDKQLLPSIIMDLQHHRVAKNRIGCIYPGLEKPDSAMTATRLGTAANVEECQKMCQEAPACDYFSYNSAPASHECSRLTLSGAKSGSQAVGSTFFTGPAFCRGTLPSGDWAQIKSNTFVPVPYANGPWQRNGVAGMGATPDANGFDFLTEGFTFIVGYRSPAGNFNDTILDLVGKTAQNRLIVFADSSATVVPGQPTPGQVTFNVFAGSNTPSSVSVPIVNGDSVVIAVTLGRKNQCLWVIQRGKPIQHTCVSNANLIGSDALLKDANNDNNRFIGKNYGTGSGDGKVITGSLIRAKMWPRVVNPTEIVQFAEDALASLESKGLVGTLGAEDSKSFGIIDLAGSWFSVTKSTTYTLKRECNAKTIQFSTLEGTTTKYLDLTANGLTGSLENGATRAHVKYYASPDERSNSKLVWYNGNNAVVDLWTLDVSKGIPEMASCPMTNQWGSGGNAVAAFA